MLHIHIAKSFDVFLVFESMKAGRKVLLSQVSATFSNMTFIYMNIVLLNENFFRPTNK